MRIRANAPLDPGEVIDARGARPGCGIPVILGGGGGALGVIAVIVLLLLQLTSGGGSSTHVAGSSNLAQKCTTGASADQNSDCRVVAVVDSVQAYWSSELPAHGVRYTNAPTVLFSGQARTGCGTASSATGPFYCPADARVYLDLSFFDELRNQLGANGGAFAQAYVVAHEYGHHVQDLLGVFHRIGKPTSGATGSSVRLELQADCYAGVWAHHAQESNIIEDVSASDISDALNAAAAVGDDRIQQESSGKVKPGEFTHGTAEQRDHWFNNGYGNGNMADCDTFGAASL